MKITGNESELTVIRELGQRIRQRRISLGLTQAELAQRCGVSPSTETRIENGEDTKISNFIKILSGLNMLENVDILIPEAQPDFKALYERRALRQRTRSGRSKQESGWKWGEDEQD